MGALTDPTGSPRRRAGRGRLPALGARVRWVLRLVARRVTGWPPVGASRRLLERYSTSGAPQLADSLAFGALFALLPAALLVIGVAGFAAGDPGVRQRILDELVRHVPPIEPLAREAIGAAARDRDAYSVVGLIGALWGVTGFYARLDDALWRIFPGGPARGALERRLRGLFATVLLALAVLAALALAAAWGLVEASVAEEFAAGSTGRAVWRLVVPVVTVVAMAVVVAAVYLLVPTRRVGWRDAWLPALLAGTGMTVLTDLFALLAPRLVGSLAVAGALAAVFGALVWLSLSFQMLLFGAAWCSERATRREGATTLGGSRSGGRSGPSPRAADRS